MILQAVSVVVFALFAVPLCLSDLKDQLLPDHITIPMIVTGLMVNIGHAFTTPGNALLGAVCGYALVWSIEWLYSVISGKQGIGLGDAKLLAALGAFFGLSMLPYILLIGSLSALICMLAKRIYLHDKSAIAFGPFLLLGGICAYALGVAL